MASLRWLPILALLTGVLAIPSECAAQVVSPPPPEKFNVTIHYRIRADRNERIKQFEAMQDYFDSLGFVETDTDDSDQAPFDPSAETMIGTIAGKDARKLLRDPRALAILLIPSTVQLPEDGAERAKVKIDLLPGLPPSRQRDLWFQVRSRLELLGYQDLIGYDHTKFTVLRGSIPYGELNSLIRDVRGLPGGWLLPETGYEQLPEPLKSTTRAVRVIEVTPHPADAPPLTPLGPLLPPIEADKQHLAKLAPEVRNLLADPVNADKPLRVEIIFDNTVNMEGRAWRKILLDFIANLGIEGQLGPIVTLTAPKGAMINDLALIPQILHIRLPRSGAPLILTPSLPAPKEAPKIEQMQYTPTIDVMSTTRLNQLHANGKQGQGVRVVIIDSDFTGYSAYINKGLPERVTFLDLTAERNFTLEPDPMPNHPEMGHGTHLALAVALAAPNVDLTLVRVDPSAPHQVYSIAQAILGEQKITEALAIRSQELRDDVNFITRRREIVNAEYLKAFDNFDDTDEAKAARKLALDNVEELTRMEKEFQVRVTRLTKLQADIAKLEGIQVVVCPLLWNTGQAIDGLSPLSQYLDLNLGKVRTPVRGNPSKVRKMPVWFQAAGDTRGQGWTGLYHDRDGNGVMEFCHDDKSPIPPGRWTQELNFLGFQREKERVADLPANSRIRVAIQWREPHDPTLPDESDTYYRNPLADLQVLVLRQRDPSGKTVPSDELELIGFSQVGPQRLVKTSEGAVYEQAIEVTIPTAGRYAIRIEGRVPNSVRPSFVPTLPALERTWELRPRIFVEGIDAESRAQGRPVLMDYIQVPPGIGSPGDAIAARTVGAIGPDGRPRPYSAFGAGPGLEMLYKPNVLAFDWLPTLGDGSGPARGTSLATAFAGGTGASLISAGAPQSWMMEALRIPPGHVFIVPELWLRK